MVYFKERDTCLMCNSNKLATLLKTDRTIPIACYSQDKLIKDPIFIPYNIQCCDKCFTVQTKYLGDLEKIYGGNHANLFGTTRNMMNKLFTEFILEDQENNNILEIGAGNGDVCDAIKEKSPRINYTIVDPSYWGKKDDRKIIYKYYEECATELDGIETVIMSHVFEHFYNPLDIIKKIGELKSVKRVYLNFPDLEYYIKFQNYHVLNPEHIYYVENEFIVDLFKNCGFILKKKHFYNNFAVFFEFTRVDYTVSCSIFNKNTKNDTILYFETLISRIEYTHSILKDNPELPVYIWPSSMHTNFVLSFGLNRDRIENVLDNSPAKIGKYLYGFNLLCRSFSETVKENRRKIIILAGGCYNNEIVATIPTETNIVVVI